MFIELRPQTTPMFSMYTVGVKEGEESDPFAVIEEDEDELEENELDLDDC